MSVHLRASRCRVRRERRRWARCFKAASAEKWMKYLSCGTVNPLRSSTGIPRNNLHERERNAERLGHTTRSAPSNREQHRLAESKDQAGQEYCPTTFRLAANVDISRRPGLRRRNSPGPRHANELSVQRVSVLGVNRPSSAYPRVGARGNLEDSQS